MHNISFLSYAEWKTTRTALAGATYVVKYDKHYIGIVIDSSAERYEVYCAEIVRFPDDPNLVDFETNIEPTAVEKVCIEDAIAAELT
jgi:hypothetical protein